MDSYQAVSQLLISHPNHFHTLTQTPVTFHYNNGSHSLRFTRPILHLMSPHSLTTPYPFPSSSLPTSLDFSNLRIFYSPPFQSVLQIHPDKVGPFYKALHTLTQLFESPDLVHKIRLESGSCAVFFNRRILHGRTHFDEKLGGNRYFRGTYVGLDEFYDRFRVLSSKLKKEIQ